MKRKTKEKMKKMWSVNKIFIGIEESAGAFIQRCSIKNFCWKIAQNSQENTGAGVSF